MKKTLFIAGALVVAAVAYAMLVRVLPSSVDYRVPMAVNRGVDGRPVGEDNAPHSFEERGGGWVVDRGAGGRGQRPTLF